MQSLDHNSGILTNKENARNNVHAKSSFHSPFFDRRISLPDELAKNAFDQSITMRIVSQYDIRISNHPSPSSNQ